MDSNLGSPVAGPAGYVQGMSAADAGSVDRPVSRADDPFQPISKLKEMIETKNILIRDVKRCQEYDHYTRERGKYVVQMERLALLIEGLDKRYSEGPAIIERLEKDISELESKIKTTENKIAIMRLVEAKQLLASQ